MGTMTTPDSTNLLNLVCNLRFPDSVTCIVSYIYKMGGDWWKMFAGTTFQPLCVNIQISYNNGWFCVLSAVLVLSLDFFHFGSLISVSLQIDQ